MRNLRLRRGSSYVDALMASLILAVAVVGLTNVVGALFKMTETTRQSTIAYSLARLNIERVKNRGFPNTPDGTTQYYYNMQGTGETTTSYAAAQYTATVTITSSATKTNNLGQVFPTDDAVRTLSVSVSDIRSGRTLQNWGTILVRGGV